MPVEFTLTDHDLSIYDVESHGWKLVSGDFSVGIGASSRDIRLKGSLTV